MSVFLGRGNILISGRDPDIVKHLMQEDLDRVSECLDNLRLTLNTDKTDILWCHSERKPHVDEIPYITMKGKRIRTVVKFNYLGALLDKHLSFIPHCRKVLSSVNLKLYNLRQLRKFIDTELALMLFRQMILPVFDYADIIIDGASMEVIRDIQTAQNNCLRCCVKIWDPRDISIVALNEPCNCRMLYVRRQKNLSILMYSH